MKVVRLPDVTDRRERRVAIGFIDGVHMGHREVIRGCDTVLTFDPHPLTVVRPEAAPKLLTTFNVKRDIIAGLGVEELVVIPFDEERRNESAEEFIDDVLIGTLNAVEVSVGENFRFGKGAQGNVDMLRGRSEFTTRIAPLVEVDGEAVSSTQIRALVGAGEVDKAARMLGGPFIMEGEVVHGDKRGRALGVPTANLIPDEDYVHPGHGVFAAWAHGYPFESVDALVEQMKRDIAEAERVCAAATVSAP